MTTSSAAQGLQALMDQHGPSTILNIQALCLEATHFYNVSPSEILKFLSRATPEELAAANDPVKALRLIGVLVLKEIDRALVEAATQNPSNMFTLDLTPAPQLYTVVRQKHAEDETEALLTRVMGDTSGPHTIH